MGEPDLAIGKYIEAIDLGVGNATVVRQVVQLLSQRQRLREADEVIKNFERRQQPFTTRGGGARPNGSPDFVSAGRL